MGNTNSNKATGRSYGDLYWHANAIDRLASIIRATMDYRNLSIQAFARLVKSPAFNTIWRLSKGQVRRPSQSALKGLAPYIYRPVATNEDGTIELNPHEVFSGPNGWLELAEWACNAPVTAPAAEADGVALSEFLVQYCAEQNLTQIDFEAIAEQKTSLTGKRLREIVMGAQPIFESDLYWLSHLVLQPDGSPYSWEFWQALRSGTPAEHIQNGHDEKVNCQ